MKIISVGNPKGGVGKSMIAFLLAGDLCYRRKKKILLVDSDKQGTLIFLTNLDLEKGREAQYETESFQSVKPDRWQKKIKEWESNGYDYVIIDLAGNWGTAGQLWMMKNIFAIIVPFQLEQIVIDTTAEFLYELPELIGKGGAKILGIANKTRYVKERKQLDLLEGIGGMKVVGELMDLVRYERFRRTDQAMEDERLIKLMDNIYKEIK